MDGGVRLRVPRAEFGLDDVTGDVVRTQAGWGLLDDGEVLQPRPQFRDILGVRLGQHRPEHRFAGHRGVGADGRLAAIDGAGVLVGGALPAVERDRIADAAAGARGGIARIQEFETAAGSGRIVTTSRTGTGA